MKRMRRIPQERIASATSAIKGVNGKMLDVCHAMCAVRHLGNLPWATNVDVNADVHELLVTIERAEESLKATHKLLIKVA